MKKFTLPSLVCMLLFLAGTLANAQETGRVLNGPKEKRGCHTMEALEEAIRKDPTLPEKMRVEGERRFKAYVEREQAGRVRDVQNHEIIIPVVFHLVDLAGNLSQVSDRDIYDQVEILNRAFSGAKLKSYTDVIPQTISSRIGEIPVRFVLARRDPSGNLTSGIERRVNTTPNRISIKSTADGGLDAWDTNKYLNIWAGTFSGAEAGLLGIATFPFTTTEGPHGTVVGLFTLGGNSCRSYYTTYAEGATLVHELGHYFYLYHTFGDQSACNNADFRTQAGWQLTGNSLNDDTPAERGNTSTMYGNPSMNYQDGCAGATPTGMMYGSFMNYYDDRALFMFSAGHKARVIETINIYRPGFLTTNGAVAPVPVTDAYVVGFTPGGGCDQRQAILNNIPVKATVRNLGNTVLNSVVLTATIDGLPQVNNFALSLAPGADTVLVLPAMNLSQGQHTINVAASLPNGVADAFPTNDALTQYVNVVYNTVNTPVMEGFDAGVMPANFYIWNPHGTLANGWIYNSTSGYNAPGSAFFRNYNVNQPGTLDEMVLPAINMGSGDSAALTFQLAHAVYDATDVSGWDALEVYISNDGGQNYKLIYKKSGNQLKTITAAQSTAFLANPTQQDRWRQEVVNLTPYIGSTTPLLIKFRNVNAYGNNTIIDDINVFTMARPNLDVMPVSFSNVPDYGCDITSITPSVTVMNNGAIPITSLRISYQVDNQPLSVLNWTGNIPGNSSAVIALNASAITVGNHTITAFTAIPNGVNDQLPSNDTIRKQITVFPLVNAPLKESFEGASFPPAGWAVGNPDNGITWNKATRSFRRVEAADSSSAWINNYAYAGNNRKDELVTPKIKIPKADSVFLSFDLSAINYSHAGNLTATDTLEVMITTDCGASYRTIYKKHGWDLQTVRYYPRPATYNYIAGYHENVWRRDSVSLLPFLNGATEFQVIFKSSHNSPGNNIFLDNVNVFTENVPEALKQRGYQIMGNPFSNSFRIWNYVPAALEYINIYDATGRLVWSQVYHGNASNVIGVDLSGKPAGVYLVKFGYKDESRNQFERVIKR